MDIAPNVTKLQPLEPSEAPKRVEKTFHYHAMAITSPTSTAHADGVVHVGGPLADGANYAGLRAFIANTFAPAVEPSAVIICSLTCID